MDLPAAPDIEALLSAATEALAAVPSGVSQFHALDDGGLLRANQLQATAARVLGATGALIAGEIARRSSRELGSAGLAQRTGHRTAENFIKATTGATGQQAVTAVRIGVIMHEAADAGTVDVATGELAEPAQPWLRPVAEAVQSGALSTAAAESIARGLGAHYFRHSRTTRNRCRPTMCRSPRAPHPRRRRNHPGTGCRRPVQAGAPVAG